jgi:hypothetical protein
VWSTGLNLTAEDHRLQRMAGVERAGLTGSADAGRGFLASTRKWHAAAVEAQAYEDRLLCTLLEQGDPKARVTYVPSSPVAPEIVEYYLSLSARRMQLSTSRLTLIALGDRPPAQRKATGRADLIDRSRRRREHRRDTPDRRGAAPHSTPAVVRPPAPVDPIPNASSESSRQKRSRSTLPPDKITPTQGRP